MFLLLLERKIVSSDSQKLQLFNTFTDFTKNLGKLRLPYYLICHHITLFVHGRNYHFLLNSAFYILPELKRRSCYNKVIQFTILVASSIDK